MRQRGQSAAGRPLAQPPLSNGLFRIGVGKCSGLRIRRAGNAAESRLPLRVARTPCYTDPVFQTVLNGAGYMANLTLSLDSELLQKAREAALREHTSVNALVREYLERYVDATRRRMEALDALDALAERTTSASPQSWTRESLHERRSG